MTAKRKSLACTVTFRRAQQFEELLLRLFQFALVPGFYILFGHDTQGRQISYIRRDARDGMGLLYTIFQSS